MPRVAPIPQGREVDLQLRPRGNDEPPRGLDDARAVLGAAHQAPAPLRAEDELQRRRIARAARRVDRVREDHVARDQARRRIFAQDERARAVHGDEEIRRRQERPGDDGKRPLCRMVVHVEGRHELRRRSDVLPLDEAAQEVRERTAHIDIRADPRRRVARERPAPCAAPEAEDGLVAAAVVERAAHLVDVALAAPGSHAQIEAVPIGRV